MCSAILSLHDLHFFIILSFDMLSKFVLATFKIYHMYNLDFKVN